MSSHQKIPICTGRVGLVERAVLNAVGEGEEFMAIKLQGGMGNCMFQIAYGLSKGCRTFDISSFDNDTLRHYEMDQWDLDIELVRDPNAEQGYFQDEKLFDKYIALGNFCRPAGNPNPACAEMAEVIKYTRYSCFIGVRRADYLWPERINYHGVMDYDYYFKALEHLPEKAKFFVFTDDLEWARSHFTNSISTIVDVNGPNEKAWDIWLMSLCQNAIIANSSFHWWGSFLQNGSGTVIAPKRWYADETVNAQCTIVPERWVRI